MMFGGPSESLCPAFFGIGCTVSIETSHRDHVALNAELPGNSDTEHIRSGAALWVLTPRAVLVIVAKRPLARQYSEISRATFSGWKTTRSKWPFLLTK